MELRRKSSGALLCDNVGEWSDWYGDYNVADLQTVAGVPYRQPIGVLLKKQDVTLIFADHYPGSTQDNYWALVNADRKRQLLTFRDSHGDVNDVYVASSVGGEASERWQEVRTKDIRKVKLTIIQRDYIA